MSRSAVNRVLLALVGLVLLVGALLVLLGGFDAYRRLGVVPPSWWPLTSPDQPVLSHASRTRWHDQGWYWPVVVAGLAVVVLLSLWWLVAQFRRSAVAEFDLRTEGEPQLRLRLRAAALTAAVREAALLLPGVAAARVRLVGRRRRLALRAQLLLEPGGDPVAAVKAFRSGPLDHAAAALGSALPLDLRIQVAPQPAEHPVRERRARRGRRVPRVE
ncbi:alkaline shock response membrane anchor protein AmaP [Kitasatospora sp. NPDC006697]|uniref:alkaline shock response membrane anchor protein AmaP n=1 Tax=Kitasatospora sp. NPDC006697 TaxID=3364020 RepID=UPI0036A85A89